MTAQTSAERQRALRQARSDAGLTEVRGIYAREADHAPIKEYAAKLGRKRGKQVQKPAPHKGISSRYAPEILDLMVRDYLEIMKRLEQHKSVTVTKQKKPASVAVAEPQAPITPFGRAEK
jgi:hypothetical protein